jgi:hypothetical protein
MPPVGGANCPWGISSNSGDFGGVQYEGEQGRARASCCCCCTCDYEDPVVTDADTCAPTPSVAALPWSVKKSYTDGQPNDNVGLTLLGVLALHGETGILSIHPSGVEQKLQARLFYHVFYDGHKI